MHWTNLSCVYNTEMNRKIECAKDALIAEGGWSQFFKISYVVFALGICLMAYLVVSYCKWFYNVCWFGKKIQLHKHAINSCWLSVSWRTMQLRLLVQRLILVSRQHDYWQQMFKIQVIARKQSVSSYFNQTLEIEFWRKTLEVF